MSKQKRRPSSVKTSWNRVADWYADHMRESGEYQREIIFPGALRLLEPRPAGSYLDIACGEGSFLRMFASRVRSAHLIGFDASLKLIGHAKHPPQSPLVKGGSPHNSPPSQGGVRGGSTFLVADATKFSHVFPAHAFDGATCLMAIQNIELFTSTFREAAHVLRSNGAFVIVMNHPAFRQPRQSGWGWDEERKLQYRRVDRYLSLYEMPIVAHPGSSPHMKTLSYHRPLSAYINALTDAGFVIDRMEEWTSHKVSDSGPRAKAENNARKEIPLFLAIRARRT